MEYKKEYATNKLAQVSCKERKLIVKLITEKLKSFK